MSQVSIVAAGSNMALSVDRDGMGSSYGSDQIATLTCVPGLDIDTNLLNGNLIV